MNDTSPNTAPLTTAERKRLNRVYGKINGPKVAREVAKLRRYEAAKAAR